MRPKNKKSRTLSTILQITVGCAISGGILLFLFLVSDTRELMSIEVQLSPQYLLDIGVESNRTYITTNSKGIIFDDDIEGININDGIIYGRVGKIGNNGTPGDLANSPRYFILNSTTNKMEAGLTRNQWLVNLYYLGIKTPESLRLIHPRSLCDNPAFQCKENWG
jgi:hypothetical protein